MELRREQSIKMDLERAEQIRNWAQFVTFRYIVPLFLAFWFADFIWYPSLAYTFGLIRVTTAVLVLGACELTRRQKTLLSSQIAALVLVCCCTFPLNLMVYLTGDPATPYYAGLILTTVGVAAGLRLTWLFYALSSFFTIVPMLISGIILGANTISSMFWLNLFFLTSINLIMTVSMFFKELLHSKEFTSRLALEDEISHRGTIIREKTAEGLRLGALSKQFSPQIVHSIQSGTLSLDDKVRRAEICSIFIDIIGSTERFTRLDREDLQKLISMYMEDTMGVFLKYDLTIDKFLGDGVLAFSNDPVQQPDYIDRVIRACLELMSRINHRRDEYEALWLSNFEISVGISTGFASVGFYGSDKHVKSYTAIGKVVNLASRLCDFAKGNQILVSHDVVDKLTKAQSPLIEELHIELLGTPPLKGFESDKIIVHSVQGAAALDLNREDAGFKINDECPNGHGVLHLAQNERGQYELKCRFCNFVLDSKTGSKSAA